MPLVWPKPVPLVLLAAPLLLMWAPARAFLGSAVSKLPSSTRFLSETILRRRHRGGGGASGKGLSCSAMASPKEVFGAGGNGGGAKKVIVITGASRAELTVQTFKLVCGGSERCSSRRSSGSSSSSSSADRGEYPHQTRWPLPMLR